MIAGGASSVVFNHMKHGPWYWWYFNNWWAGQKSVQTQSKEKPFTAPPYFTPFGPYVYLDEFRQDIR
jgi:hypothetical protein